MKTQISLVAMIALCNAFAGALDNWHWRNPLPTSAQLYDVTFGGDQFVAVGSGGAIVTSTDGENWTARSSGSQAVLNGVAYGNGTFLAFGSEGTNGVVLTSPDGLTWTLSIAQTAARLRDVTYAQGMFVGVGDALFLPNGALRQLIETSPDGRNWTTQASLPGFHVLNSIAYGNGTFVAVGERGLIVTSTDGSNWTEIGSGPDRTLRGVAFGDGLFVAVGYEPGFDVVLTSPDGLNWATAGSAPKPLLDLLLAVNYGNGLFVACGAGNAVLASPDGLAWTEYDLDLGKSRVLGGIAYGNRHHAAVGYWFPIHGVSTAAIVTSPNGVTWTDRTSGVVTAENRGLAFGKGRYVATSFIGEILASTNGSNWTQTAEMGASGFFFGAAYGNGVFLAVGGNTNGARQGLLLVSTNGMEWTNRSPPGATRLWSAAYGGGRFVVVGGTNAHVSTNGWDWSASTSATASNLIAVTFAEGLFVGVGSSGSRGRIQTSTDGLDWLTHSSGTNASLTAIAFGNGKYVAVGRGAIVNSTNAADWLISQTGDWNLEGVAFGGGFFVAVGLETSPLRGVILTSEDGIVWTERHFSSGTRLWSVVYDGRTFLIGGDGGTILQSDPLVADLAPSLAIRRASGIELILSGTAGATYRIEYSDELGPGISWGPLTTIVTTNGTAIFTDAQPPAAIQRFYRAASFP